MRVRCCFGTALRVATLCCTIHQQRPCPSTPAGPRHPQVDEDTYNELAARMPPSISWTRLSAMERKGGEERCEFELACSAAGGCEMVDVV